MKKEKFESQFEQLIEPIVEKCVSRLLDEKKESTVENPEQWLSVGQACKEFGCTQFTLRNAMSKAELAYYQPENRTYVKRIDVFRYLERLRFRAKDEVEQYPFLREEKQ